VRKAPELLDNFFEEILQFQTDQSGEVRRELIAFLETTTYVSLSLSHTHTTHGSLLSLHFVSLTALSS
jgi:HPt (histidine-containing phosphotransfer) domain-containing protein